MWKCLFIYIHLFLIASFAYSKPPTKLVSNYDVNKQRLLLHMGALTLYTSFQGELDYDSTMFYVAEAEGLDKSLFYDEGYNPQHLEIPGSKLINDNKIEEAEGLLQTLNGEDKIKLYLQLAYYFLHKPGFEISDIKNAIQYANEAKDLSSKTVTINLKNESNSLLGKIYAQSGNLDKSKEYFLEALNECKKIGNENEIAFALMNLGENLYYSDPDKLMYLEEAYDAFQQLGDKVKALKMLTLIITFHFQEGKMDLVREEQYLSLKMQEELNFMHSQYTHYVLAYIATLKGDHFGALDQANKAVEVIETTQDTTFAPLFYLRLGIVYQNINKDKEALEWYLKPLQSQMTNKNKLLWYKCFLSAAMIKSKLGQTEEAISFSKEIAAKYPPSGLINKLAYSRNLGYFYEKIKDFENAEKYFLESIHWVEQLPSIHKYAETIEVYSAIASLYIKLGDNRKAKFYLEKALDNNMGKAFIHSLLELNYLLFKLDSADGNYISAIKYFQNYKEINDSITSISQRKLVEEYQVKYETAKKEQDIELLQNEAEINQHELENAELTRNVIIGSLVMLSILFGLLYNRYRLKKKQQVEINKKNVHLEELVEEREWLLKEIHHRVKNNLQIVMSLLNTQSAYLDNEAAIAAIRNSQHRMHAMSLIHQKLYQSDSFSLIEMQPYIYELVEYYKESLDIAPRIQFSLEIEKHSLDVSQAVPIGLILNEAISNAAKYAFNKRTNGEIKITFLTGLSGQFVLKITDDGVGIPENIDADSQKTFGLNLMKGLSNQLDGVFRLENAQGVKITVTFPKKQDLKGMDKKVSETINV